MYRWELDDPAEQEFASLGHQVRVALAALMDAVVIVDPVQCQRRRDEPAAPVRTLYFGPHDEGSRHFPGLPTDDLVLVVRIRWLGE